MSGDDYTESREKPLTASDIIRQRDKEKDKERQLGLQAANKEAQDALGRAAGIVLDELTPRQGTKFLDRRTGPARLPGTIEREVAQVTSTRGPSGSFAVRDLHGAVFFITRGRDGRWIEL